MTNKGIRSSLAVFDYANKKLCDLYDSQNDLAGQAYNISFKQNMKDGIKELEFTIPFMIDDAKNYRWKYIKSEYLVRLIYGDRTEWFVLQKPKREKSGKQIVGVVSCYGIEATLKTKNIYKEFDDENGIGTISYLVDQILAGTGWHRGYTDPMLEADGVTEKIRSLSTGNKQGALGLMSTACNLFRCFPVYKSDTKEVELYNYNNRDQVLEGEVGRNLDALSVDYSSSDIITRLYVEGEYGDDGYIGIDSVNPTGLNYIFDFDYYREIGVFTQEHETALSTYLVDMAYIKSRISANMALMNAKENEINDLIGQCKMVLYYTSSGFTEPAHIYGDPTAAQQILGVGDSVIVLNNNGTYRNATIETTPAALIRTGDYGIAKFVTPSAGSIGAGEVQIEAKEQEIKNLQRKINATTKADKIAEYNAEIANLRTEIQTIYTQEDGLYDQMYELMKTDGLMYELDNYKNTHLALTIEQDEIESDFIIAMGDMLRDGYKNDQNYIEGQEQHLFDDSVEAMKQMSRPTVSYSFNYVRLAEEFDIQMEDIKLNAIFKIHDKELDVDDNLFVSEITIGIDDESSGSVEVSNKDITINTNSLGALLSRMSQLSDLIEQKNTLYDRAQAINKNGTLYVDRLNGQIDVIKNQILSTVSNWYTDEHGNILFLSADGSSAMMLSGSGFMLSNAKDNDGNWIWRSFGTGEGFTADEIVAGFISAERIEAGSIATSKLEPDAGNTLVITGNPSITALNDTVAPQFVVNQPYSKGDYVNSGGVFYVFTDDYAGGTFADAPVSRTSVATEMELMPDKIIQYVGEYGYSKTYIQLTDPTLDPDKQVVVGDYWIYGLPEETWRYIDDTYIWEDFLEYTWGIISGFYKIYCWDGTKWKQISDTSEISVAFTQITQTQWMIEQEAQRANAAEGQLNTKITQSAEEVKSEAYRYVDDTLVNYSTTSQTADQISAYVTTALGGYSTTTQTASMISSYVTTALGDYSTTTQTASQISAYVSSNAYTKQSGITINAAGVSVTGAKYVKIESGGSFYVKANNLLFSTDDQLLEWTYPNIPVSGGGYSQDNVAITMYNLGVIFTKYTGNWDVESERLRRTIFRIGVAPDGVTLSPNADVAVMGHRLGYYSGNTRHWSMCTIQTRCPKRQSSDTHNFNEVIFTFDNDGARYDYNSSTDTITLNDDGQYALGRIRGMARNMSLQLGEASLPFYRAYVETYYGKTLSIRSFSSREYKRDIHLLDDMGEKIDALQPVSFRYKKGTGDKLFYGLIYEDTVDIMPVICEDNGEIKTIEYGGLTPVLLKEVQQLRKRVKELEEKIK